VRPCERGVVGIAVHEQGFPVSAEISGDMNGRRALTYYAFKARHGDDLHVVLVDALANQLTGFLVCQSGRGKSRGLLIAMDVAGRRVYRYSGGVRLRYGTLPV
jgi:hypothetical protein